MKKSNTQASLHGGSLTDRPHLTASAKKYSLPISHVRDSSYDFNPRYSISYVPRMSEHPIDSGKNLEEARLKVVLLACEVERLGSLNYNLVKENELLRLSNNQSERERDIQTKLAVVLAENEKLAQLLSENSKIPKQDSNLVTELLEEIKLWKEKYADLERSQSGYLDLLNKYTALQEEKSQVASENAHKQKEINELINQINQFKALGDENVKLRAVAMEQEARARHFENLLHEHSAVSDRQESDKRSMAATNVDLQAKLMSVSDELERTKQHIAEKDNEIQRMRNVLSDNQRLGDALRKLTDENERFKTNAMQMDEVNRKVRLLIEDNQHLNEGLMTKMIEVDELKKKLGTVNDLTMLLDNMKGKVELYGKENERLNNQIGEKVRENDSLRHQNEDLNRQLADLDALKRTALALTQENDELRKRNEELNQLHFEIDQLNMRIKVQNDDLARLKEALTLQIEENERLKNLVDELERIADENEMNKRSVVILSQENEAHKQKIDQLAPLAAEVQNKRTQLVQVNQEHEALTKAYNERMIDIDVLRRRTSEGEERIRMLELANTRGRVTIEELLKAKESLTERLAELDSMHKRLANHYNEGANLINILGGRVQGLISTHVNNEKNSSVLGNK